MKIHAFIDIFNNTTVDAFVICFEHDVTIPILCFNEKHKKQPPICTPSSERLQ